MFITLANLVGGILVHTVGTINACYKMLSVRHWRAEILFLGNSRNMFNILQ